MTRFQNAQTGRRLDSNGREDADGHESNDGDYQVWQIRNTHDNSINLVNQATSLYLDSNGADKVYTLTGNGDLMAFVL